MITKPFIFRLTFLIFFLFSITACTTAPTPTPPSPPTSAPPDATLAPLLPTATTGPIVVTKPRWSVQTGGAVWGTASISEGVLYVGSDDGSLYALDARSGSQVWKYVTEGIVRSQPAVSNGLVYFASDDGFLYSVNVANGRLAWQADIGNALPRMEREALGTKPDPLGFDYMQSSPVASHGLVYVGSLDGNIYALAADTGQVAWTYTTGAKVRASPLVQDGIVYIGSWDKYLYALDAYTGELVWKSLVGGQIQSTAAAGNGLVFTASRKASVVALDLQTGDKKWEFEYGPNNWVESSPLLSDGTVYIGSSMYKVIIGLDSRTGEIRAWNDSPCIHWSTPVISGDRLYIGGEWGTNEVSTFGGIYGLDLVDGRFASMKQYQWHFPVVSATLEAESIFYGVTASPLADQGVLYFGGLDGKIYAVRISS